VTGAASVLATWILDSGVVVPCVEAGLVASVVDDLSFSLVPVVDAEDVLLSLDEVEVDDSPGQRSNAHPLAGFRYTRTVDPGHGFTSALQPASSSSLGGLVVVAPVVVGRMIGAVGS
jgi:hypothetical protein